MASATLLVIIVVSLGFVAQPFWRNQNGAPRADSKRRNRLTDLQARRDTILAAIKDLEFDYEMGKVSKEDYAQMNAQFRREAMAILQQIDQSNGKTGSRKKLEAELQALRRKKNVGRKLTCESCGASLEPQHRFCGNCGQKVAA